MHWFAIVIVVCRGGGRTCARKALEAKLARLLRLLLLLISSLSNGEALEAMHLLSLRERLLLLLLELLGPSFVLLLTTCGRNAPIVARSGFRGASSVGEEIVLQGSLLLDLSGNSL